VIALKLKRTDVFTSLAADTVSRPATIGVRSELRAESPKGLKIAGPRARNPG